MRVRSDKAIVFYSSPDVELSQEKIDGLVALRLINWPTPTYISLGKIYLEANERGKRLFQGLAEKHRALRWEVSKDIWVGERFFLDPHKIRQPTEASDDIHEVRDRTKIEDE